MVYYNLRRRKTGIKKGGDTVFDERRFRAQLTLRAFTLKKLADALGIHEVTLHKKIKDNGRFTRSEINKMIEILGIDDPESIFFAEELASTQVDTGV